MDSVPSMDPATDGSALSVYLHGGVAQLLLVDPAGRRLGTDARTGASFGEIPDGSRSESTLGDEDADQPIRELLVMRPMAGTYTVRVTGERDGAYTVDAGVLTTAVASADATVADVTIGRGDVHEYQFGVDRTSPTPRLVLRRVR
jgi:hypothetical protein